MSFRAERIRRASVKPENHTARGWNGNLLTDACKVFLHSKGWSPMGAAAPLIRRTLDSPRGEKLHWATLERDGVASHGMEGHAISVSAVTAR